MTYRELAKLIANLTPVQKDQEIDISIAYESEVYGVIDLIENDKTKRIEVRIDY